MAAQNLVSLLPLPSGGTLSQRRAQALVEASVPAGTVERGSWLAPSRGAIFHDFTSSPPQQAPREPCGCARDGCVCGCGEACVFSLTGHEFSPRLPRRPPSLWRWGPSLISRVWEAAPKQQNSVQLLLVLVSKHPTVPSPVLLLARCEPQKARTSPSQ